MTPGKLEVVIKVNARPTKIANAPGGWGTFVVDCEGREVSFTIRPKVINKFDEAEKKGTAWVAAINGKMGPATERGFVLENANVQVFEVKPKAPLPPHADDDVGTGRGSVADG